MHTKKPNTLAASLALGEEALATLHEEIAAKVALLSEADVEQHANLARMRNRNAEVVRVARRVKARERTEPREKVQYMLDRALARAEQPGSCKAAPRRNAKDKRDAFTPSSKVDSDPGSPAAAPKRQIPASGILAQSLRKRQKKSLRSDANRQLKTED